MQEVTKIAKNRVMAGLESHKNEPKQSLQEVETHALLEGHQYKQTREEEGGTTPSYFEPQNKFSTTEIPLEFSGFKAKKMLFERLES